MSVPKAIYELYAASGVGIPGHHVGGKDVGDMIIAILSLQAERQGIAHSNGSCGSALIENAQPHLRAQRVLSRQVFDGYGAARAVEAESRALIINS